MFETMLTCTREIIDESDVFVDVHRAIRRIQPVSYYRVPKELDVPEANDVDSTTSPMYRATTVGAGAERKLSSLSDYSVKAAIPKFKRRRSVGGAEPLHHTKTLPDVRAHLAHLGPSNLASRPKQTRINTVKIKPAHALAAKATNHREVPKSPVSSKASGIPISDSTGLDKEAAERAREVEASAVETTGLLGPGKSSSDGAHVVGYGTLATSPTSKAKFAFPEASRQSVGSPSPLRQSANQDDNIGPLQMIPEFKSNESKGAESSVDKGKLPSAVSDTLPFPSNPRPSMVPVKLVVTPEDHAETDEEENPDENDSGSTMKSTGTTQSDSRLNAARSGSIFERDVDVNGVRKVVLDVHQGQSEDEAIPEASESQALLDPGAAASSNKDKKKKKKKPKKKKKDT